MTDKEILKKAIEKVEKGGFQYADMLLKKWWRIEDYDEEGIIIEWGDPFGIN